MIDFLHFYFIYIPQPTPHIPRLLLYCLEFFFHHSSYLTAWLLDVLSGWSGCLSSTLTNRILSICVYPEVKDLSWSSFSRQLVWQCKSSQRGQQKIILKTVIVLDIDQFFTSPEFLHILGTQLLSSLQILLHMVLMEATPLYQEWAHHPDCPENSIPVAIRSHELMICGHS